MLNNIQPTLFSGQPLANYLDTKKQQINCEIEKLSLYQLEQSTSEETAKLCEALYKLNPLSVDLEGMTHEYQETKINVPQVKSRNPIRKSDVVADGITILLTIPYTGNRAFWSIEPSSSKYLGKILDAQLTESELTVRIQYPVDTDPAAQINSAITTLKSFIEFNVKNQIIQIDKFYSSIDQYINECIEKRKTKLKKLGDISSALDIPLKRKSGMPDIESISMKRRVPIVNLQSAIPNKSPEPGINKRVYQDILTIIRFSGRTFEESAATFNQLNEEGLRDVHLSALNVYFEGSASGEAFRQSGKTDICIKEKGKAAFIAECKVWSGQSEISKGLDQLLSYLTWRDCKAALIVFNKGNTQFSTVLSRLPEAIRNHSCFVSEPETEKSHHDGEWRFVVKHKDDDERRIQLHVFAFNILCAKNNGEFNS